MNEDDYKFVLQDLRETCIGARYSYEELMGAERVPFKFQTIIERLILPVADASQTLGGHMLAITPKDPCYRIYDSLKAAVRYFVPKPDGGFKEKKAKLSAFVKSTDRELEGMLIQEVIISNLALMGFKL
ncbi:MAG: hypothetical protein K5697_13605 [Lachnospiraceae bacterium]|nr:hypothetical protein [Lachnospiraceae bacterium]